MTFDTVQICIKIDFVLNVCYNCVDSLSIFTARQTDFVFYTGGEIMDHNHNENGRSRKFKLWVTVAVLLALLTTIVVSTAISSRRFTFDGTRLRIVSYEPGSSVTMRDRGGNYMHITAASRYSHTVEYLGETFEYTRLSATQEFLRDLPGLTWAEPAPTPNPTERRLAEISFVERVSRTVSNGPVSLGTAVASVVISFFFFLLGTAAFIYPREFWEIEQAFNFRIQNAEPTEWGILVHQIGGVFTIFVTFIVATVVVAT